MLLSNQALWPTETSAVASGVDSPKFRGGGTSKVCPVTHPGFGNVRGHNQESKGEKPTAAGG